LLIAHTPSVSNYSAINNILPARNKTILQLLIVNNTKHAKTNMTTETIGPL
jgi:hypothetical protein